LNGEQWVLEEVAVAAVAQRVDLVIQGDYMVQAVVVQTPIAILLVLKA
jgi:hypothetical protein